MWGGRPAPPLYLTHAVAAHTCLACAVAALLTGGVVSVVRDFVILGAVIGDVVIFGDVADIIGIGTLSSSFSLSSELSSPPYLSLYHYHITSSVGCRASSGVGH